MSESVPSTIDPVAKLFPGLKGFNTVYLQVIVQSFLALMYFNCLFEACNVHFVESPTNEAGIKLSCSTLFFFFSDTAVFEDN